MKFHFQYIAALCLMIYLIINSVLGYIKLQDIATLFVIAFYSIVTILLLVLWSMQNKKRKEHKNQDNPY
jgi:uncharacterized membrane protein YdjX (TVP38/TMEM64 family)